MTLDMPAAGPASGYIVRPFIASVLCVMAERLAGWYKSVSKTRVQWDVEPERNRSIYRVGRMQSRRDRRHVGHADVGYHTHTHTHNRRRRRRRSRLAE